MERTLSMEACDNSRFKLAELPNTSAQASDVHRINCMVLAEYTKESAEAARAVGFLSDNSKFSG